MNNKRVDLKHYNSLKYNINNFFQLKKKNAISINNLQIDTIQHKNSDYLMKRILNGNEYIFVNTEFWRTFCKKNKVNESSIVYQISQDFLSFSLEYNKKLFFQCHQKNNIINKISFTSCNQLNDSAYLYKYQEIEDIYNQVKEYYNIEKKFTDNFGPFINTMNYGFLVNKIWIDEWKRYSFYELIKESLKSDQKNKIIDNI